MSELMDFPRSLVAEMPSLATVIIVGPPIHRKNVGWTISSSLRKASFRELPRRVRCVDLTLDKYSILFYLFGRH